MGTLWRGVTHAFIGLPHFSLRVVARAAVTFGCCWMVPNVDRTDGLRTDAVTSPGVLMAPICKTPPHRVVSRCLLLWAEVIKCKEKREPGLFVPPSNQQGAAEWHQTELALPFSSDSRWRQNISSHEKPLLLLLACISRRLNEKKQSKHYKTLFPYRIMPYKNKIPLSTIRM